jgi:pimeloyl-ACP methyl ester carboxylesterase
MATILDDDRRELVAAERRLFAALGLDRRSERLTLTAAPVEHARVLEVGEGPPLLLVHGAGTSAALWAPLLVHLHGFRCIAVDLPGCGLTDAFDHRGADLRDHASSFLAGVLDALDLGAVPIVANSLGATYSLYLAASEPARVSHLALLGAPGVALPGGRGSLAMSLYSRPALGRMLSALSPPLTAGVARRLLAGICGRPAVGAMPDEMFEVVAATLRISEPTTRTLMPELFSGRQPRPHHALTEDELARVTAPTSFVWGSEDRFQDPDDGRRAAAAMPDGRVTEVPGGHHPWWDDAEGCAALIEEAVSSRPGTDRLSARPDRCHPGG